MTTRTLPEGLGKGLGGQSYDVPWDGTTRFRTGPFLAFDTETEVIPDGDLARRVPRLALMTVSDGYHHAIIRPDQVPTFLMMHKGANWVGYNVAFDWHVVDRYLALDPQDSTLWAWEEWQDAAGRTRDLMALDFLVRLAGGSEAGAFSRRGLDDSASDFLGITVDKSDTFRMRYGELIGRDFGDTTIEEGFWSYAIKDVIVTHLLGQDLYRRAMEITTGHGASREWGPLTIDIQSRAAIVLHEIGRNGMRLDPQRVSEAADRLKGSVDTQVEALRHVHPELFDYYRAKGRKGQMPGDFKVNDKTGVPKLQTKVLRPILAKIAEERGIPAKKLPRTEKTAELSTALDLWREIAPDDPFVASWAQMADDAKLLQFLVKMTGQTSVHTVYEAIVRTGRTSARNPNIQNMPREDWFRGLFIAGPGRKLVIADYSAIELVTLAAVCLDRYGWSSLADTIRSGRDPHAYTAALVGGWDYEEVLAGLKAEKAAVKAAKEAGLPKPPTPFSDARQKAKPVNFGLPGGLGADSLVTYAKQNYGVPLSRDEAAALRKKVSTEVYPELALYLADDGPSRMARSLQCRPQELASALEIPIEEEAFGLWLSAEKIIRGEVRKKDGNLYSPYWRQKVWDGLTRVNNNPALKDRIAQWDAGPDLHRRICADVAVTLTGRVRSGLSYTEKRNTPFQGLAADGAKLALWRLWKEGHRIVAFIHDEIVTEVDEDRAEAELEAVSRIMSEEMSRVLKSDLPVKVEAHIAERWGKG